MAPFPSRCWPPSRETLSRTAPGQPEHAGFRPGFGPLLCRPGAILPPTSNQGLPAMNAHSPHPTLHPALGRLADRSLLRSLAYVDGRWTAGAEAADHPVTDPATG